MFFLFSSLARYCGAITSDETLLSVTDLARSVNEDDDVKQAARVFNLAQRRVDDDERRLRHAARPAQLLPRSSDERLLADNNRRSERCKVQRTWRRRQLPGSSTLRRL